MAIKTILVIRKDARESMTVAERVAKLEALIGENEDFITYCMGSGDLFIYSVRGDSSKIEAVIRELDAAGVLCGCSRVEIYSIQGYREFMVGPDKGGIELVA